LGTRRRQSGRGHDSCRFVRPKPVLLSLQAVCQRHIGVNSGPRENHLKESRFRQDIGWSGLQDLAQSMNAANKPKSPVFEVDLNAEDMRLLRTRQKEAWVADGIPDYATRIDRMDRLMALLVDNKEEIAATLSEDYGRRSIEGSLFIEVLNVVNTLKYNKVHLREWMEPELHEASFPDAVARVEFQPKGVVGVISPWNFPWLLAFGPVANVFAAGNVCMLKPSELAPRTSALMAQLVAQFFHETEFTVLQGGPETGAAFAALPFDHLIYTGGTKIGGAIMGAAAKNLTPVTLELGGKSPVLVGRTADIGDVGAASYDSEDL
jgi:coniferyl-aldehyde dehydrogenase